MYLPSGVGHDAQEASLVGPMGMIFVPSVDGISSLPRKEFTRPEDCGNGANVFLRTLLKLDRDSSLDAPAHRALTQAHP